MAPPRTASAKPGQPPSADLSVLVNRVDALSQKAGLGPIPPGATKLPLWKRWLGGEKPEYDGTGLRDVVNTNAIFLDGVKRDGDVNSQAILELRADVQALKEAPAPHPFP